MLSLYTNFSWRLVIAVHWKVCACCLVTFLSGHMYWIGVWFSEDQETNFMKTLV